MWWHVVSNLAARLGRPGPSPATAGSAHSPVRVAYFTASGL
jgi:hypothetical protein